MSKERIESLSKLSTDRFKSSSVSNNFSINSLPRCPSHEIRYLKEDFLSLKNVQLKNVTSRDLIPPQTPNSEFNFQETFKPIPPFPNLDNLDIPYVRDKGVKYCISYFGDYFNCTDYKTNFLQFWFLDVLTDCVWCLQDKFQLPINVQKIVIDWFLAFVDLIRNPRRNLSRKAFFTIFKEAILIAAEVVDEGCVSVPLPKQVFQLMEDEEQSGIDSSDLTSSISSIAINQSDYDNISCIDIEEEAIVRRFQLPPEPCRCDEFDLSTIYTLTETDSNFSQDISLTFGDVEGQISDDMSLYKPDFNIPSRFLKSFEEEEEETEEEEEEKKENTYSDECSLKSNQESTIWNNADNFKIYEVEDKFEIVTGSCVPNENSINENQISTESFKIVSKKESVQLQQDEPKLMSDQEILKGLTVQKLLEQRLVDMSNPCKGWISAKVSKEDIKQSKAKEQDEDEWVDVNDHDKKTQLVEDESVLNFGALWAIIEIVFKYFYDSFQFSLVKIAFHATPEIISQKLNNSWPIVKTNKERFVKPKYHIPKPPKISKKKEGKIPQKSSSKSKKNVKSEKNAMIKKSKSKFSKKEDKSSKSSKKAELTAAQKKALTLTLAKQREEKRLLEEELKKIEENKFFLFPLIEGATDDFFRDIFPNWTKSTDKLKKSKQSTKGKENKKHKKEK